MLLLTTNKKSRYIIHGVPKDTLIILHRAYTTAAGEHLTVICPVTGYPTHFSCLVCPVTGQLDPAFIYVYMFLSPGYICGVVRGHRHFRL